MSDYTIHLHKMKTKLDASNQAQYFLTPDNHDAVIKLHECIGKTITIHFSGIIHCVSCGRKTNKSFNQGYCFPCMRTLAQCDMCIVKPEQCHFDEGTCREPEWGLQHCFQPHYVYLANTGTTKVGITRGTNIPSRWIDQGASYALPIYQVDRRLTAGLVETSIKHHISDKTNWRKMLQQAPEHIDLYELRDRLLQETQSEISNITDQYGFDCIQDLPDHSVQTIHYPVEQYPKKITSFNLDKKPDVEGILLGIKGQYLILDTGVINIRKFGGYQCQLSII